MASLFVCPFSFLIIPSCFLPFLTLSPHSYANSVLQALYFCSPFRDLIVQYPDPSVPDVPFPPPPPSPVQHSRPKPARKFSVTDSAQNSNPNTSQSLVSATSQPTPIPPSPPTLMSALRSLYVHISRNPADKGIVAPKAFIDKLKELNELFRGGQHQDAHEFLNFLLNRIVEEMEVDRRAARNASPVRNGNAIAGPPLGAPSSQQNPVLDGRKSFSDSLGIRSYPVLFPTVSPPSDTISPSLQSSSLDVPPPTNANGDSRMYQNAPHSPYQPVVHLSFHPLLQYQAQHQPGRAHRQSERVRKRRTIVSTPCMLSILEIIHWFPFQCLGPLPHLRQVTLRQSLPLHRLPPLPLPPRRSRPPSSIACLKVFLRVKLDVLLARPSRRETSAFSTCPLISSRTQV